MTIPREKHPFPPSMRVQKGGRAWLTLLVACSLRNGFTAEDLRNINPKLFKNERKSKDLTQRGIKRLADMGLIDEISKGVFKLNDRGQRYVSLTSRFWALDDRRK